MIANLRAKSSRKRVLGPRQQLDKAGLTLALSSMNGSSPVSAPGSTVDHTLPEAESRQGAPTVEYATTPAFARVQKIAASRRQERARSAGGAETVGTPVGACP